MKMFITKMNEEYRLSFGQITQFCGYNMPLKKYVVDSITKHFSSEKYKEFEDSFVNNITIDGEVPGRKQWESYRLSSIEDVISEIQISKASILTKYLKESMASFDYQNELMQIDDILLRVFAKLNKEIADGHDIEIQYSLEDLFAMIQKTSVRTKDGRDIHELDASSLLDIFLDLIKRQQEILPEKRLYIFENIDHIISIDKYIELIQKCSFMSEESNVWFIFSTSIDGYVYVTDENIENVNIFNNDIYQMPSMEQLLYFVKESYPIDVDIEKDTIVTALRQIIHKIDHEAELYQPFEIVLLKIINDTNNIHNNYWKKTIKSPEIACLTDKHMV